LRSPQAHPQRWALNVAKLALTYSCKRWNDWET
jgi:hypothetical protein